MKLALIDNYDSFTYNLYDYICRLGAECDVFRNDALELEVLEQYDGFMLSPGPKTPADAGLLMDILEAYSGSKPILGVCLGHQALGVHFGAKLSRAKIPVHGKPSLILHSANDIFLNLENPMQVMRYHSLLLQDLPDSLIPLAFTDENELMAMRHAELPLWGVQFHPESVLSPSGLDLLKNWLDLAEASLQNKIHT